jgi:hypothetical protein
MHQLKTIFSPFSSTTVTAARSAIEQMIKYYHTKIQFFSLQPAHAPTNIHFFFLQVPHAPTNINFFSLHPALPHGTTKLQLFSQQQHYSNR